MKRSEHSGQHIKWRLQKCLVQAVKRGVVGEWCQNKITADLESEMMFSSYQRLIRLKCLRIYLNIVKIQ